MGVFDIYDLFLIHVLMFLLVGFEVILQPTAIPAENIYYSM